jgi:hypothetical protein
MMFSRRKARCAGIVALAAMLFAQAALALAACDIDASPLLQALAGAAPEANAHPCHEPAEATNLCLAHCQGNKQTLDKPQVKVPPVSLQPALAVHVWRGPALTGLTGRPAPVPTAAPPSRILFQSFLI